jgi:hypothetical protein
VSSLTITAIVFGCIAGGTLLGMAMRAILPEQHLSPESKDVVKMGMGLVGTMTALVLGLLIASAKSGYDAQRNGVSQTAASLILLDRTLAHYGPEAQDTRDLLRSSVTDMVQRTWPDEYPDAAQGARGSRTEGRYEALYEKIQGLVPKNEAQRAMQAQALKTAMDIGQARWTLAEQRGSSIPVPFLVVLVSWLTLLFASFSLFSPPNATVIVTLMISALAVASALFLILEMDRAYDGIIHISSGPMHDALGMLGQ